MSVSSRALSGLAGLALSLTLLVVLFRAHSAWSVAAHPPGVAITSGCEEESFHLLWRQSHGQNVYADPTQPPYSEAYFNWLFYRAYGAATSLYGSATDAIALIRTGRLFTLAGALLGALALGLLGWRLTLTATPGTRLTALALAFFVFLGPFVGWWALTIRPDLWAVALESIGLVSLLFLWRRSPLPAAILAAVLFYAAWSFKQNFVQGLGVALLFLAWRRQWKPAVALLGLSVVAWSLTFYLLGPDYRAAMFAGTSANEFDFGLGWTNFSGAVIRITPLLVPALCLPFLPAAQEESPLLQDSLRLAQIGLPLVLVLSFAGSCKIGAASNYFFTPSLFLAILTSAALSRLRFAAPGVIALVGVIALCGYLFISRSLDLRPQAEAMATRWSLWQNAPSPRYAEDRALNLPWLNPGAPAFLTAYKYPLYRKNHRPFAHDGIGGLIRRRYFASLLLSSNVIAIYDDAPLDGYRRGADVAGCSLWLRIVPPDNPNFVP